MSQTTNRWIEVKLEKCILRSIVELEAIGVKPEKIYMNKETLVSLLCDSRHCTARQGKNGEPEYFAFNIKIEERNDLEGDTIIIQ